VSGLGRRVIVPVPVLTPGLSSLWIGLVTPLPTGLARPLVESLVNEVVLEDDAADQLMPHRTIPFREAVGLALERIKDLDVATTWASAGGSGGEPEDPQDGDPAWSGGTVFTDRRVLRSDASPEELFAAVCAIGGDRGYGDRRLLWNLRGLADKAVGGSGLRRGRRHPTQLHVGEVVDFWRVEELEAPHLLRLRAEMKLPGEAWLEFRIREADDGRGTVLEQLARFHPRGLSGRLYWAALQPFHASAFAPLARDLVRDAESVTSRAP
jgi:hypothetical protein